MAFFMPHGYGSQYQWCYLQSNQINHKSCTYLRGNSFARHSGSWRNIWTWQTQWPEWSSHTLTRNYTQTLSPAYAPLMQYPSNATNITKQWAERVKYFILVHVIIQNRNSPGFLFYHPCSTRGKVDDSNPPLIFFLPFARPIHSAKWYIYIGHNLNHHARGLCWMRRQAFQH